LITVSLLSFLSPSVEHETPLGNPGGVFTELQGLWECLVPGDSLTIFDFDSAYWAFMEKFQKGSILA